MDVFFHHSRLLRYRCPQGAAPCGAQVAIRAACGGGLTGAEVVLRLWQDGVGERLVPMAEADGLLRAQVTLPDAPCLLWYYFVIHSPEGHTLYYGGSSGGGGGGSHGDGSSGGNAELLLKFLYQVSKLQNSHGLNSGNDLVAVHDDTSILIS